MRPRETAVPDAAPALAALAECASSPHDRDALARVAVREIGKALPQATWRGVYWLEGDHLVLGPYEGPATEHVRIPVGTGVCGTAVAEGRDQVVVDVRERENYLACSATVRSEIVVLVRSGRRVLGQLDLDSDRVGAFGEDDHRYLRMVAHALGALLASR
jgi:L-methionine (R)-S-oxide reductase